MSTFRRFLARCGNLVSRHFNQTRLDEEIEDHLARQTEENLRSGMTPTEARRQAILKFGPVETIQEQYHAEKGLPLIESIFSDLRYSLRILRKNPGFTAIAGASLALAIGANTTIFTITKRVLLDRLAVPHAAHLRLLHWQGDGTPRSQTCGALPTTCPKASARLRSHIPHSSNSGATTTSLRIFSPSKMSDE